MELAAGVQKAASGPDAPSRRILIGVHAAILGISVALLAWPMARDGLAPGLLTMRVAYKLATPILLGPAYPVAVANLAVALYAVTLGVWALRG